MRSPIVFLTTLLLSGTVFAIDPAGQRYIDQMTQGGMTSIKQAAQSMYNTGETNTQVLDVAAEVLLQNYSSASDPDALAWVAKALGKSHNGRYYSALKEVADSRADKKLRKHTATALKEIRAASGDQYAKGGVDLHALRDKKAPASTSSAKNNTAAAPAKAPAKTSANGLDVIRNGMSMQEAFDLVGAPTSTSARATGKAWIPFNYKGSDLVRSYALYKGKGRIVFSSASRYDSTMRVIEVQVDPEERGYP
jgi:hypothetical protein